MLCAQNYSLTSISYDDDNDDHDINDDNDDDDDNDDEDDNMMMTIMTN